MKLKNIYLFLAPSGSGKTAVINGIEGKYNLRQLPSYTTRPKRRPDDKDHTYVTVEEFEKLGNRVAYTYYAGNYYCATSEQVEEYDLFAIEPDGIGFLRENYHGNKGLKIIFLNSPLTCRMDRMEKERGFDAALERIKKDVVAFKNAAEYADKIFLNDEHTSLNDLVEEVYDYIAECEMEGLL